MPLRKQNCHDDPWRNLGMLWHTDAAAWSDVGIWAHVPWPTSCSMPLCHLTWWPHAPYATQKLICAEALKSSNTILTLGPNQTEQTSEMGCHSHRYRQFLSISTWPHFWSGRHFLRSPLPFLSQYLGFIWIHVTGSWNAESQVARCSPHGSRATPGAVAMPSSALQNLGVETWIRNGSPRQTTHVTHVWQFPCTMVLHKHKIKNPDCWSQPHWNAPHLVRHAEKMMTLPRGRSADPHQSVQYLQWHNVERLKILAMAILGSWPCHGLSNTAMISGDDEFGPSNSSSLKTCCLEP